ncbi:hypothetical protein [Vibrio phage vB_VpaS_VP-RY-9]|nr:hypothetical protein [Vibrio phage vB_VpaS_VP-RY-9]
MKTYTMRMIAFNMASTKFAQPETMEALKEVFAPRLEGFVAVESIDVLKRTDLTHPNMRQIVITVKATAGTHKQALAKIKKQLDVLLTKLSKLSLFFAYWHGVRFRYFNTVSVEAPAKVEQGLGCGEQFEFFGAWYPDGVCIDGYMWDLDSGEDGNLTHGGDDPCPLCNTRRYYKDLEDEIGEAGYLSECVVGADDEWRANHHDPLSNFPSNYAREMRRYWYRGRKEARYTETLRKTLTRCKGRVGKC